MPSEPPGLPRPMRLQRARELAGHTLETLAEAVGVNKSTVWRIETGRQRPRPALRLRLATAVGRTPETVRELADDDDDGDTQSTTGRA